MGVDVEVRTSIGRHRGHHVVRARPRQGHLVGFWDLGPHERLFLPFQLEQEVPGQVKSCTVPLLSLHNAGLISLPGLWLDRDRDILIILPDKILS